MPHIHTKPGEHDTTVTAYIIRLDTERPTALLHMHRKLHKLLPIGGHVELHENSWQAIAHELTEESGYTLQDLQLLQPPDRMKSITGSTFLPYPIVMNVHEFGDLNHFHDDTAYIFVAKNAPHMPVADGESTDLRWVTQRELDELVGSEIHDSTKEVYAYAFMTCLKSWERVNPSDFTLA